MLLTIDAYNRLDVLLPVACLFGLGDAILNTQLYSILGFVFRLQAAAAFASFKLLQSMATGILFFCTTARLVRRSQHHSNVKLLSCMHAAARSVGCNGWRVPRRGARRERCVPQLDRLDAAHARQPCDRGRGPAGPAAARDAAGSVGRQGGRTAILALECVRV